MHVLQKTNRDFLTVQQQINSKEDEQEMIANAHEEREAMMCVCVGIITVMDCASLLFILYT